ncbi:DUF2510 domain-containing protein [Streptomyces sp. TRM76323]|uniref:DUF2510 domain-containing protein n=1 Tax=Streptomyces tamarix TaxID=3078565 RepID=A0ABU3QMZ7_9ACTN|nr:DUF2510 domain-containing protein [Streptomyces tamarix]MDT9684132.1 DUF2510 domain-containing protein [Streptomyces tamarix]
MNMTTPPGWYPDPAAPAVERWWDGTAWTGHTRPAGGPPAAVAPPGRYGGRGTRIAVAALAVAAVTAAAVLLRPGGGETPAAAPPAPSGAVPSVPAPAASTPAARPSPAPSGDGSVLVDQLNGISLPLPKGWEKAELGIDQAPTMVTTGDRPCPNSTRFCRPGRVLSRTLASAATTHRAMAEQDVAEAAEQLYGEDVLGNKPYGGVTAHRVVAARQVVVAGRTGYLVRWRVTTGKGPGGHVQSLVFPSPGGVEQPVAVRFAFDAGPDGPPLSVMDEITEGIRPIGGSTSGGVGSSIAPGGDG